MTEFAINLLTNNLSNPDEEIMKGVKWGKCDKLFTPAYWKIQYHFHEEEFSKEFYKMGDNLIHEICACILGGFGMRSELGLIAFERMRDLNCF